MGSKDRSGVDRRALRIPHRLRDLGMTGGDRVGDGTLLSEPVLFMNQNASLFDDGPEYLVYNKQGQQMGVVAQVPRSQTRLYLADVRGRSYLELIRRGDGRSAEILVTSADGSMIGRLARHRGTLRRAFDDGALGETASRVGDVAGGIAVLPLLALWEIPLVGKPIAKGIFRGAAAVGEAVVGAITKGQVQIDIEDPNSKRLGTVVAEHEAPTEFTILDSREAVVARIVQAPQVLAREEFMKTTNYAVEFPRLLDEPFRSLALATAVAIGPVFEHLNT